MTFEIQNKPESNQTPDSSDPKKFLREIRQERRRKREEERQRTEREAQERRRILREKLSPDSTDAEYLQVLLSHYSKELTRKILLRETKRKSEKGDIKKYPFRITAFSKGEEQFYLVEGFFGKRKVLLDAATGFILEGWVSHRGKDVILREKDGNILSSEDPADLQPVQNLLAKLIQWNRALN